MVKLALITAETVMKRKNNHLVPCVVLIGRDDKGVKRSWRTPFWPYCLMKEVDFIRLIDDKNFNLKRMLKDYQGVKARTLNKQALTKLIFKDSKTLTKFDHQIMKWSKLEGKPIFTYEADLSKPGLLALRYLIDKGIKSGVEIEDGQVKPVDMDCKLRIWYIDFEAYSKRQCSLGPKKDVPIIMVSFWDNYLKGMYTLYVKNPIWKKQVKFKPLFKNHWIIEYKSEAALLGTLIDLVTKIDPDLFTAWNLNRYDIVKWFQRMDAYKGILDPKLLSPFRSLSRQRAPYRIKGRILFDLMQGFKRFTDAELRSYSLSYIMREEKLASIIPLAKVPFKGSAADTWDKYPQVVFKRNVNDVLIIKALDEKYQLIEGFNDLRKEFGALFHEVLMNYRVLDTALMRFVNDKVALITARRGKYKKDSFLGAVVIEPVPGKYKYVAQFDFGREYPNIIKVFNIGPETYRAKDFKGQCYTIKYKNHVYKFAKKPISLLAQLINYFFKKRDDYEVLYKQAIARGDEAKIKMWWRRIFNVKKMTNAIYGVMDFSSFRLHKKECSEAVAIIGRMAIEQLTNIANEYDYKIIYGDTDSIFVQLKSLNVKDAYGEGEDLVKILNKELSTFFTKQFKVSKAPAELGLKKIYNSFLLVAKKYYAGKYFWDEKKGWKEGWDFKGVEVVRSDSSDLERETLETIIKMILNDQSYKDINSYWKKIQRNYMNRVYSPLELAYPLQIKYVFEYYIGLDKNGKQKTIPSHIRAALASNKLLNTDYIKGDKPRRLPIKSRRNINLILNNRPVSFKLKDVSITEDLLIPDWIKSSIDYQRIYDRLATKVAKLFNLIQVQSNLGEYL